MKLCLKTRSVLLWIVIFASLLVMAERGRHSVWATRYSKMYKNVAAGIPTIRKQEAALRSSGKAKQADALRAWIGEREHMMQNIRWHWLKALVLDEP